MLAGGLSCMLSSVFLVLSDGVQCACSMHFVRFPIFLTVISLVLLLCSLLHSNALLQAARKCVNAFLPMAQLHVYHTDGAENIYQTYVRDETLFANSIELCVT